MMLNRPSRDVEHGVRPHESDNRVVGRGSPPSPHTEPFRGKPDARHGQGLPCGETAGHPCEHLVPAALRRQSHHAARPDRNATSQQFDGRSAALYIHG